MISSHPPLSASDRATLDRYRLAALVPQIEGARLVHLQARRLISVRPETRVTVRVQTTDEGLALLGSEAS